jgi:hypothetical protein
MRLGTFSVTAIDVSAHDPAAHARPIMPRNKA